jgi:hypothetical protein
LVPSAVAAALDLTELPGKPTRDRLVDHLQAKQLLPFLDNPPSAWPPASPPSRLT